MLRKILPKHRLERHQGWELFEEWATGVSLSRCEKGRGGQAWSQEPVRPQSRRGQGGGGEGRKDKQGSLCPTEIAAAGSSGLA